jgi:hypothetical protein
MTAPIAFCTADRCTQRAAARIGTPLLPNPPGVGLGFVIVWPIAHRGATGLPVCLDHAHHTVDLMLMDAQPGAAA